MRTWAACRVLALGGLVTAARLGAGCVVSSSNDCNALGTCVETTTDSTSSTTTGTTTTVPPACIDFATGDVPSPGCGVFVAPTGGSDATGDGSQANPFATLGKALGAAAAKPVYTCAGALKESVVVKGDHVILGGFACDSWAYTGDKPALTAAPDAIAITVDDGASLTLQDFTVASVSAKKEGGSSIAIFVRTGATLDLARVDVTAGDGASGASGVTPPDGPPEGAPGTAGGAGCASADAQIPGGDGGIGACDGTSTNGGLGGPGTKVSGGDGSEGEPGGGTGVGGVGAKQAGTSCKVGGQGSDGMPGDPGTGALATTDLTTGALTDDTFNGESGEPGKPGAPGQGGGGGGGGKVCANGMAGPSGGGGGAGGCGGQGGGPGGAGGSSITIAAYQAKAITLTGGSLKTGKGGIGGAGVAGQDGGFGGPLGPAGGPGACAGGQGGAGGPGGPGGGGAGGHSIGIVWTGTAPVVSGTTYAHAAAGTGGAGGPGSSAPSIGAIGLAQDTLELK